MKIYVEKEDKTIRKQYSGDLLTLLNLINVNPETVIVVKDDALITRDHILKNSDEIKILSVVSGG